jgi:hypothetical protein
MPIPGHDSEEICRRGKEIYDRGIRALVEPELRGKFLALDIETGDYEIDASEMLAIDRAEAKKPGGGRTRYLLRIGYPAAHRIGGSSFRLPPMILGKVVDG